jgi:patatin-like phospholipase/acyl hydrolase
MDEIQRQSGAEDTPLPCEYFDLIGGTSTGGLIAIMLGRLRMVQSHFGYLIDVVGRRMYCEVH